MADVPDWLPELVLFEDYDGSWPRYEEALYDYFETEFLRGGPFFRDIEVKFKRHPMLQASPYVTGVTLCYRRR